MVSFRTPRDKHHDNIVPVLEQLDRERDVYGIGGFCVAENSLRDNYARYYNICVSKLRDRFVAPCTTVPCYPLESYTIVFRKGFQGLCAFKNQWWSYFGGANNLERVLELNSVQFDIASILATGSNKDMWLSCSLSERVLRLPSSPSRIILNHPWSRPLNLPWLLNSSVTVDFFGPFLYIWDIECISSLKSYWVACLVHPQRSDGYLFVCYLWVPDVALS